MKITASIFALVLAASVGARAQSTHSTAHIPSITELELQAQLDAAKQWRRDQRDRLVSEGFCAADTLPVEIASTCNWRAFGYPQMGSQGGSE